jgi:hypothetical protein
MRTHPPRGHSESPKTAKIFLPLEGGQTRYTELEPVNSFLFAR